VILDLAEAGPSVRAGAHGLRSVREGRVWFDPEVRFGVVQGPSCQQHGAMNAVNPERSIYRCLTCHVAAYIPRAA
jgi:hypothetical protein